MAFFQVLCCSCYRHDVSGYSDLSSKDDELLAAILDPDFINDTSPMGTLDSKKNVMRRKLVEPPQMTRFSQYYDTVYLNADTILIASFSTGDGLDLNLTQTQNKVEIVGIANGSRVNHTFSPDSFRCIEFLRAVPVMAEKMRSGEYRDFNLYNPGYTFSLKTRSRSIDCTNCGEFGNAKNNNDAAETIATMLHYAITCY